MAASATAIKRQAPLSLKQVGRWQAALALQFRHRDNKTLLTDRQHVGPLTVQRPFYPEGDDTCHTYLIHPPGGMVGGDTLDLHIQLHQHSHALVTTPSAGKVYRSTGAQSQQTQHFSLAEHACLEWFPQEMIVFQGSKSLFKTRIDLAATASFIGWEMLCLGRQSSQDFFTAGDCTQQLHLYRDNQVLLCDRFATAGDHQNRAANWGLKNYSLYATFIAVGVEPQHKETLQAMANAFGAEDNVGEAGLTMIDDIVICRCLSHQARHVKKLFSALWSYLRPAMLNKPVVLPRIWLT